MRAGAVPRHPGTVPGEARPLTVEERHPARDARTGARTTDTVLGGGIALAGVALLLPRVCHTVALVGDSPELVAAGSEWGVAHASGYPLLVSLLHVVMRLVPAHAVWAANATSAVAHAAAAGIVAVAVSRLARSRLAGITAAAVLLLSRGFFFASQAAEVFPLNDLLLAVLLAIALDAARVSRPRGIALLAAVFGLALAHHQTIVLVAPALLGLALPGVIATVRERPARLAAYVVALVVPFALSYALAWIAASRHPFVSWGDVHDLRSLARLVLRSDYGTLPRSSPEGSDPGARLATFARLLWRSAGPVPIALGVLGAAVLWRRARREAGALLLAFVFAGPIFAMATDLFQLGTEAGQGIAARFVVMPLVPLAMLAGAAVAPVEEALRARRKLAWLAPALPVVIAGALSPRIRYVDLSDDRRGEAFVHDLLRGVPDGSLVLLGGDGPVQAAQVACTVEHACGSRIVMAPGMLFLDWYRAELAQRWPELPVPADLRSIKHASRLVDEAMTAGRPVFVLPHVVERDPSIAERWSLVPTSLLLQVVPRDAQAGWPQANDACEECSIEPFEFAWPSLEAQTEQQLEAALANQARYARSIDRPLTAERLETRRNELAAGLDDWLAANSLR